MVKKPFGRMVVLSLKMQILWKVSKLSRALSNFSQTRESVVTFGDSLYRLPRDSFEWKIAAYRAVVAAVTYNEQRHLITGERWFPVIKFCRPESFGNCCSDLIVGRIKSEGKEFYVVSGPASPSSTRGLGYFDLSAGVSGAWSTVGFRSVGSRKAATYISRKFGRLLFEVSYGGTNCDWEWIAQS